METLGLLLRLKLTMLRNAFSHLRKRSMLEFITLIVFFLAAGVGLFFLFLYSFRFFREQEPFGPILIDETFYLFTFALFVMLFISSAVSSYASLFRSGEVPFLISQPVQWESIYFIKLVEALWLSSWSFLFIAVPFMCAYGLVKDAGLLFPVLCLIFFIPYVVLAGMGGTLVSTLLIWLLPDRKRRRIALLLAIACVVFYFTKKQPEILKEQGSLAGLLSGYLPHVTFAKNAFFPSTWVTRGILALSNVSTREIFVWHEGLFYLGLLVSNALFFLIPSHSVGKRLYPLIYLRSQDFTASQSKRRAWLGKGFEKILDRMPWPPRPVMAFIEKDLKTFVRDPAEWSQMIIFFGLLLLYFANLKNLEFHVLKDFWKNIVFVLNTVGTFIVLSSFSMRFVFPMLSLEGSRFWIIDLAPVRFTQLLLEKFLLGTIFSALLTIPLILLSGVMMEISTERIIFTTGLGFFVCVALTGLSVGLGAKFPNFKSTNPAEIISGFGGSVLLVCHLSYLAVIGLFLFFSREAHWIVFVTVAAASLLVGTIPIKIGRKAIKRMEF